MASFCAAPDSVKQPLKQYAKEMHACHLQATAQKATAMEASRETYAWQACWSQEQCSIGHRCKKTITRSITWYASPRTSRQPHFWHPSIPAWMVLNLCNSRALQLEER